MIFSISRERESFSPLFAICIFLFWSSMAFAQRGVNYPVATVSAASYETNAAIAPGSIASSFGANLTTVTLTATDINPSTPAIELPTNLGSTTVQINNILCGLLYVSPTQINFVLPEELNDGFYLLIINSPNGNQGETVKVSRVQPSIFAMNSDGQGVIAASVVRVKADGSQQYESLAELDAVTNRMIPKPIDLGPAGERVFLEIYLTGIRQAQDENNDGNLNEHIFVVLGGKSIIPAYAGKQGFFAGVDQVNVELPRALIGKGKLNLSIHGNVASGAGFTSKAVELEIAPAKSATPPIINNISVATANVGDLVVINGTGFGSNLTDNVVTFGGIKGDVEFANSTQLAARIPFGAKSGKVKVVNAQSEALSPTNVTLRTSLSGLVETSTSNDIPFPLQNITVRIAGTNLSTTTNQAGRFILNDVPSGAVTLEIDSSTFALSTKFPFTTLKTTIETGRDNALPSTIWLNETGLFLPTQSSEWNALTGVLTDTDGVTPVPNALIRLLGQGLITTQTTTTDNSGSYVFRNVASSTIVAEVIRANGTVVIISGAINLSAAVGKLNGVGILDLSLKNAPTNRKPIILAPETLSLNIAQILGFPIYITDPDINDIIQVSVSGLDSASLIAGTNGVYTLRIRPTALTTLGIFPLEIKVVDSQGNQTLNTVKLTLFKPTLSVIALRTVKLGDFLNVEIHALDFSPNSPIKVSISGMLNSLTGETNNHFLFRLSPTTAGTFPVEIKAIDSLGNSVTQIITVTVTAPPPIILLQAAATVTINSTLDIPFSISGFDNSVQVTTTGMQNVSIINGTNGNYTLRLTPTTVGVFPLEIKAIDSKANLVTKIITVTVLPKPNQTPSLTFTGQSVINQGSPLNIVVKATDPDIGQTIKLTTTNLPAGATFTTTSSGSETTGTLNWTPNTNQPGYYPIYFTATDDGSPQQYVTTSITITVNDSSGLLWNKISDNFPSKITSFAVDGGFIHAAGTDNNIYETCVVDLGILWYRLNQSKPVPAGGDIRSLAITSNNTLVAVVDGQGIFRTIDRQGTWEKTTLPSADVTSRVTASGNVIFSHNINGGDAFYSNDQGKTWIALSVTKFITDGNGINFTQTSDGKIYKVSINGISVVKTLTNLTTMPITASCTDNKCFAATTGTDPNSSTMYISINGGVDWNVSTSLPVATYTSLFAIGKNIFANRNDGAFVSTTEGKDWIKMSLPAFDSISLNGRYIVAKNGNDLFRTPYLLTQEITGQSIPALPSNNIKNLTVPTKVTSVVVYNSKIYVSTLDRGVMQSLDGGLSWEEFNTGITDTKSINSLVIINGNLYAVSGSGGSFSTPRVYYGGIYQLDTDNKSWAFSFRVIPQFTSYANVGYVLGQYQSKLVYSYSVGTGNGAIVTAPSQEGILDINMDGTASTFTEYNDNLYMTTEGVFHQRFGFRYLTNGTISTRVLKYNSQGGFQPISTPIESGVQMYGFASFGTSLFGVDGKILYTEDDGKTWRQLIVPELTDASAKSIIKLGDRLIVSYSKGLLISSNPQKVWQLLPLNLNNQVIKKMFVNGTDLFCLTDDGSVYQISGI